MKLIKLNVSLRKDFANNVDNMLVMWIKRQIAWYFEDKFVKCPQGFVDNVIKWRLE